MVVYKMNRYSGKTKSSWVNINSCRALSYNDEDEGFYTSIHKYGKRWLEPLESTESQIHIELCTEVFNHLLTSKCKPSSHYDTEIIY